MNKNSGIFANFKKKKKKSCIKKINPGMVKRNNSYMQNVDCYLRKVNDYVLLRTF